MDGVYFLHEFAFVVALEKFLNLISMHKMVMINGTLLCTWRLKEMIPFKTETRGLSIVSSITKNIFLTGPRGSGKTSVGRLAAESLGLEFVDADRLFVETHRQEIAALVEKEGWEAFRKRESENGRSESAGAGTGQNAAGGRHSGGAGGKPDAGVRAGFLP